MDLDGCKDQAVHKKLEEGLYKCLTTTFADFVPKGHKIHEENQKNVEGCWTQMSKLIKEMTASEENVKKFHDCLTKVPKEDLNKCHQ